jgi:hypothetical protein
MSERQSGERTRVNQTPKDSWYLYIRSDMRTKKAWNTAAFQGNSILFLLDHIFNVQPSPSSHCLLS